MIIHACTGPSERHEIINPVPVSASDIVTRKNIPQSHKAFLAGFLPKIQVANNKILVQRNKVLDLNDTLKENDKLSSPQLYGLNTLLKKYRIDLLSINPSPTQETVEESITHLLKRLDIIPVKLVMAQAIIESGWGSSGFARDGNNYFGIHCYTEGCGVKPEGEEGASFFVKTYPSELAGIEDYLWILNTGNAYRGLRETRLELRDEHKPIDPVTLAQGLSKYSEKGEKYVDMVSNIIQNYLPENLDDLLSGEKP